MLRVIIILLHCILADGEVIPLGNNRYYFQFLINIAIRVVRVINFR